MGLVGTHRNWKGGSRALYVSVLASLHICYGCILWCPLGFITVGAESVFAFLSALRPFSSYLVASWGLDMRICVWFYCELLSLGGELFSEKRMEKWIWDSRKNRGRGSCVWDAIHDIYILKSQSLKFNLFIQILILFSILVILIMNTLIIDSAVIVHVLSFF